MRDRSDARTTVALPSVGAAANDLRPVSARILLRDMPPAVGVVPRPCTAIHAAHQRTE
jgi:hypothetical protein